MSGSTLRNPLESHIWELPFHNPSPFSSSVGGHWASDEAIDYLTCGQKSPKNNIPNLGWFTDAESVCDLAMNRVDGNGATQPKHFFMPDEPVSSIYYPVMDTIERNEIYDDIYLRGSIHQTAYFWADVNIRPRYENSPLSIQSLIVDSGSSLTTFPCQTGCVDGNCAEHEHHIDKPLPIESIETSSIPCSPSCRSCLVSTKVIRDHINGGDSVANNYCMNILEEDEQSRTTTVNRALGKDTAYTPDATDTPHIPSRMTYSKSDPFHLLSTFGPYWMDNLPDYEYPVVDVDYTKSLVEPGTLKELVATRNKIMNSYFWSVLEDNDRILQISEAPFATNINLRDGNYILLDNLSKLEAPFYQNSSPIKLSSDDEAIRKNMMKHEIEQWFLRTADIHEGKTDNYFFMHKSNLWRWQKDIGLSFVNVIDVEEQPVCKTEDTPTLILDTEQPPLLSDSICGFEVAYMEGSKLRGAFNVADIELRAKSPSNSYPYRRYPIIHGCTTLETHLFLDQLATGIMGLEPWPYYPVETTMASITRRHHQPNKFSQWEASFHICFSGLGGMMRLRYPFYELYDRPHGKTTLLKYLMNLDRKSAMEDPYFNSVPPLRGAYEMPMDHFEIGKYSDTNLPIAPLPVALVMEEVRSVIQQKSRPSYTLGLVSLTAHLKDDQRFSILPAKVEDQPFRLITSSVAEEINQSYKRLSVRGLRKLDENQLKEKEAALSILGNNIKFEEPNHLRRLEFPGVSTLLDSGTTMTHMPQKMYEVIVNVIDENIRQGSTRTGRRLGETVPVFPIDITGDSIVDITEIDAINEPEVETPPESVESESAVTSIHPRREIESWDDLMTYSNLKYSIEHGEAPPASAPARTRVRELQQGDREIQANHKNEQACWFLPNGRADLEHFPNLEFRFIGGVTKIWHPEQYTFAKAEKWRCLTIQPSTGAAQLGMSFFIDEDIGFLTFRYSDSLDGISEALYPKYRDNSGWIASLRRSTPTGYMGMGDGPEVVVGVSMYPAICPRVPTRRKSK